MSKADKLHDKMIEARRAFAIEVLRLDSFIELDHDMGHVFPGAIFEAIHDRIETFEDDYIATVAELSRCYDEAEFIAHEHGEVVPLRRH